MNRYLLAVMVALGVLLVQSSLRLEAGQAAKDVSQEQDTSQPLGLLEAAKFHGSLMGMQYETWFTRGNATWDTAEAVPILGKYSSYDAGIIRKHTEWFNALGINWLLLDWSNMLWMKPDWEQHTGATHELEDTTELLLKTYAQLNREGQATPKIVLLLGLYNGVPVTDAMKRLNGIFDWLTKNYLSNPEYKYLWLYYEGKPLITVLFNPADPCKDLKDYEKPSPLDAPQWTVRWMASQLQMNHAESCGMWSWMDGTIRQLVTDHDGSAEETVVTPSCFAGGGWLAPPRPQAVTTGLLISRAGKSLLKAGQNSFRSTSGMSLPGKRKVKASGPIITIMLMNTISSRATILNQHDSRSAPTADVVAGVITI